MSVRNNCEFIGRTTTDIELKMIQTQTGAMCETCTFHIAVDVGYGDKKRSIFLRCIAFGEKAKYISTIKKGTEISILCRYDIRDYVAGNGEKRQSHEFIVDDVKAHWTRQNTDFKEGDFQQSQNISPLEELGSDDPLPF